MERFTRRTFLVALPFAAFLRPRLVRAEKPILTAFVAGYRFHDGPQCETSLAEGEPLLLVREPANRYDANAVALLTRAGRRLGYLPRATNTPVAALLDAQVPLCARIASLDRTAPPWKRMNVEVVRA